jgi:RNA recognition motif-containing protein
MMTTEAEVRPATPEYSISPSKSKSPITQKKIDSNVSQGSSAQESNVKNDVSVPGMEGEGALDVNLGSASSLKSHDERAPIQRDPQEEARKVFVGNLSYKTNEDLLKEHFSPAGKVYVHLINIFLAPYGIIHVRVPITISTRENVLLVRSRYRSLGYGFVLFDSPDAVPKALELRGSELHGRELNVEAITSREERSKDSERAKRSNGRRPARGRGAPRRGRGRGGRVR